MNPDGGQPRTLDADIVIPAAGTLGSTGVLLRSAQAAATLRRRRVASQPRHRGFAYNTDHVIRGDSEHLPGESKPV
jgi:hypothetical protein